MPFQNRVTPFSTLEKSPARGMFMGNRGILHDENQRLVKQTWQHKAWVTCVLDHTDKKGNRWHRKMMQPHRYTELFFLDEATALAAGHRPCALCRHQHFKAFMACLGGAFSKAADLDRALHRERAGPITGKTDYPTVQPATTLPDGTMFTIFATPEKAWLKLGNCMYPWSHQGYGAPAPLRNDPVRALTPPLLQLVLSSGYFPALHLSASAGPTTSPQTRQNVADE